MAKLADCKSVTRRVNTEGSTPSPSTIMAPSPRGRGQQIVDLPNVGSNPTGVANEKDWLDESQTYWGQQR